MHFPLGVQPRLFGTLFVLLLHEQPVSNSPVSECPNWVDVAICDYLFLVMQTLIVILQDWRAGLVSSWFFILIDDIAGEVFLPEGKAA